MKRNIVIAALLLVMLTSVAAQAQTVVASKGVTLHDALTDIVEQLGLAGLDTNGLPLTEVLPADISVARVNLAEIMGKLLPPQYRWEMLPDSTLKVSAASAGATSTTRSIAAPASPRTTSPAAASAAPPVSQVPIGYSAYMSPNMAARAAFASGNSMRAAGANLAVAQAAYAYSGNIFVPGGGGYPGGQYPSGYSGGYGAFGGYSQFGFGGFYDLAGRFFEDEKNRRTYGLLKINGPDRFLQSVRVVVDGRDMTVGSKANNAWNDPIILSAGPHIVEFVRETDERPILAFKRDVEIVPISVQMAMFPRRKEPEPQELRVSGNEFKNAREVYDYRQHRYVEQVSGQTTRQP